MDGKRVLCYSGAELLPTHVHLYTLVKYAKKKPVLAFFYFLFFISETPAPLHASCSLVSELGHLRKALCLAHVFPLCYLSQTKSGKQKNTEWVMFEMIISAKGEAQLNMISEVVFYLHLAAKQNCG